MEIVKLPAPAQDSSQDELFLHRILREDDGFFLGLNHSDFVCDPTYLQLISKVTILWSSMTQSSQNAVKRYMQILCTRGAIATKDPLALSIINSHRASQNYPPI